MPDNFPKTLSTWYLRALFAVMLLFGSEMLLWLNPLGRALGDWLPLLVGYLALSALILDLAARYRIRDVYDAMTLLAIYGLLNGLLLNPDTSLVLIPDTLVNRVLGGHSLLGLEMFGLLLVLTGGHLRRYRRLLLMGCLWLGFYWGVWVRWSPGFTDISDIEVPLTTLLAIGSAFLLAIYLLFRVAVLRTHDLTPPDLHLSVVEWGGVLVTLIGLFMLRVAQGYITSGALIVVTVLVIGGMTVLWFRRSARGKMLLDGHIPAYPLHRRRILISGVIFLIMAALGFILPLVNLWGINQFFLMTLGFAGVGLGWLPFIAMVLGVRALDRQSRTGKVE
jgi:hypothetical protein